MALLTLREATLSFGGPLLLDHANLMIEPGERIALLGRNGTGKSSLLKVIANQIQLDDGELSRVQNLRWAYLSQEVPRNATASVFDTIAEGLGEIGRKLSEFQHISHALSEHHDDSLLDKLGRIQHELDELGAWQLDQRVTTLLTKMDLDGQATMEQLSGGLRRRVWLARELISEPDLLLLDEPTNHLDISNIEWMEEFLLNFPGTILFISHDRAFVQRLATRIIELDRGRLSSWECDFHTYLVRRAQALDAEIKHNREFDKKLAQEEVWIRQGIKARRTRNEGRVRDLKRLREERRARRDQLGKARINLQDSERSGKLVAEVDNIYFGYAERTIIAGFSTTIMRGDRIAIIGPNGSGKTTLIKLLLGELQPDSGSVELGTQLDIAYFDQLRNQLNEELSVIDNVAEGSTRITIGEQTKHVIGYLQDFMFTPDRAQMPVKALSGGERNRLLLAKLFTRPANILVMDEPTNDLDVETLELLEELLLKFKGTLIIVSHDRAFLNNVVTSTLIIEDNGVVDEYVGNYDETMSQRTRASSRMQPAHQNVKPAPIKQTQARGKKLGYRDQRELDSLPSKIEQFEAELALLNNQLSNPELYREPADSIATLKRRAEAVQLELDAAYQRWENLENYEA